MRLIRLVLSVLVPTLVLGPVARTAEPETFRKHVVVAQEGEAADVGRAILRDGGNSVDAAVATAFALAVTHPAAGNLGGGGFLVAFDPATNQVRTFDFREVAPRAAVEGMYLGKDGRLLPRHRAGARAAGVPGTVRGLALAHAALGKLPWSNLVRPAEALARDGFLVSEPLAESLNAQLRPRRNRNRQVGSVTPGKAEESRARRDDLDTDWRLGDFPESVAVFAKPDRSPWRVGDRLIQPDLAATLRRIGNEGPDDFYRGETARRIASYMASHEGLV
ncbi:MAG: gamma-glutamyltransferase, partial [Isosphaeraceae bacterium]